MWYCSEESAPMQWVWVQLSIFVWCSFFLFHFFSFFSPLRTGPLVSRSSNSAQFFMFAVPELLFVVCRPIWIVQIIPVIFACLLFKLVFYFSVTSRSCLLWWHSLRAVFLHLTKLAFPYFSFAFWLVWHGWQLPEYSAIQLICFSIPPSPHLFKVPLFLFHHYSHFFCLWLLQLFACLTALCAIDTLFTQVENLTKYCFFSPVVLIPCFERYCLSKLRLSQTSFKKRRKRMSQHCLLCWAQVFMSAFPKLLLLFVVPFELFRFFFGGRGGGPTLLVKSLLVAAEFFFRFVASLG